MIVLASQSPRRRELLERLGIAHEVDPAHVDETPLRGEAPLAYARRVAEAKAGAVATRHPGRAVLGADTVVVLDGAMLGKPASPADAEAMLARLSGRQHTVITAVSLAREGDLWTRHDETRVTFRALGRDMIRDYVATGEPLDKAGSYGLQGRGALLVERIEGDYFGVIGLPLRLVAEVLAAAGMPYRFTR
jgi:septum formation protein